MTASARPSISVVVTGCAISAELLRTLRGVLDQTYRPHQVILVDNRPATSGIPAGLTAAAPLAGVTLVDEPVPGLSRARNAGLAAASGELVAFTDDDVVPDPGWLAALVDGFTGPEVACVTGLIRPLELATEAQRWFEEFGGFGKGEQQRRFDLDLNRDRSPLYPFAAGVFGSGANSAFRTSALRALGGFDERLGTGTPARGGEDLDAHLSVVQAGLTLVYTPAAIVLHQHHRESTLLYRQIHSYGVGLAAMLTKRWAAHPAERGQIASRMGAGLRHLLSPRSPKNAGKSVGYPWTLTLVELAGVVRGPFAYWRSVRVARQHSG
jgi:GT2 family glycosyltransferase